MRCLSTPLPGVTLIEPEVFGDDRGFFLETYHEGKFRDAGVEARFVQDNHSRSARGVLRGLHYQVRQAQGKLVRVVRGEAFDVAVDIREDSPTFRQWYGVLLNEENRRMLYIPPGFAHGFCALSDQVDFLYKCTEFYAPEWDRGVRWDDPELGIEWRVEQPLLSAKDARLPLLRDVPQHDLPEYP